MKYSAVFVLFLFLCIGGVVFNNTLNNPFEFDDSHHIVENPYIKKISGIPSFFTDATTFSSGRPDKGGQYRPLLMVSYALNYRIAELRPLWYHLINLSFHIGSAFLIYLILQAILGITPTLSLPRQGGGEIGSIPLQGWGYSWMLSSVSLPALAAGLIFLVHPFNTEVVNYISARSSVMSGFFYLLAFWCWVKYREQRAVLTPTLTLPRQGGGNNGGVAYFYIASITAFAAGMLTKESVITLPIVLLLYDLYGFSTVSRKQSSVSSIEIEGRNKQDSPAYRLPLTAHHLLNWRTYIPYIPFVFLIAIPFLVVLKFSLGSSVVQHFKIDIWSQLLLEIPILVKYWQMFIWPAGLSVIHEVINPSEGILSTLVSGILILLYAGAAVFLLSRKELKWRIISFFMFWFFIVLLPTTIIPLNVPLQENRGYLAIVSFVMIIGLLLKEYPIFRKKEILIAVLVITLGIYSTVTIKRNRIWKDDVTLWTDAVQKNPASSLAYTNLGIAYRKLHKYDHAVDLLRKSVELDGKRNFIAHFNLIWIYMERKEWDSAVKELEITLKTYPLNQSLHNYLGVAYSNLDRNESAEKEFHVAARLNQRDPFPYINLGILYTKMGRLNDALGAYSKSLYLYPANLNVMLRMGILLEKIGQKDKASELYRQIVQNSTEGNKDLVLAAQERLKRM